MRIRPLLALAALAALAGCAEGQKFWRGGSAFIARPSPCSDDRFPVYFAEGSDRLTVAAHQVITAKARALKACRVRAVRVVGLADATGTPETNLTLSQKRARRVAEALSASGLPAPVFEVKAAGAQGAVRGDGREEPIRRRAEVYLTVSPVS